LLPSPTFILFYRNSHGTDSVLLEFFFSSEYNPSVKEASTKVIVAKNGNYNKSFGGQGEEWITVELQDPI